MLKNIFCLVFLFAIFFLNFLSSQSIAAELRCAVYFESAKPLSALEKATEEKLIQDEFKETILESPTIKQILSSDPELLRLSENSDFMNYIVGLSEGRGLKELKYSLFNLWKSKAAEDMNFSKAVSKKILEQINIASDKPEFRQANRRQRLRYVLSSLRVQLVGFFSRLKMAKRMIQNEFHPNVLDGRVFDFYGYLNLKLDVSATRPWTSVAGSFGAIRFGNVREINPVHFSRIAMMASEIEQPVDAYSDNSGEVLRVISPQATRFMGKTTEEVEAHKKLQQKAIDEKKPRKRYCTNSWCVEENRHEAVLAQMAKNIMGWELPVNLPFSSYPNLDSLNPRDAFFHLYARNDTEWHAGSAYFLLATHAQGPLKDWVMNVTRDEVKHMSLFGGLYKYLRGDTYNARLWEMLKKAMEEIKEKTTQSEYGSLGFADGLTMVEVLYIHAVYEREIRKFFKSLPLKSLRKIYETEIHLTPLPSEPMDPIKKVQLDAAIKKETDMRKALARWPKKQREAYDRLEYFEIVNNQWLTEMIRTRYQEFRGAEFYMGLKHVEILKDIESLQSLELEVMYGKKLNSAEIKLLKTSLKETLRDYQIFNNETIRDLDLNVEFKDAVQGFDIVRDAAYDAVKKVREEH